jgi:hypothetical protein
MYRSQIGLNATKLRLTRIDRNNRLGLQREDVPWIPGYKCLAARKKAKEGGQHPLVVDVDAEAVGHAGLFQDVAQGHALAVAAREARHRAVEKVCDPQDARRFLDALRAWVAAEPPCTWRGRPSR